MHLIPFRWFFVADSFSHALSLSSLCHFLYHSSCTKNFGLNFVVFGYSCALCVTICAARVNFVFDHFGFCGNVRFHIQNHCGSVAMSSLTSPSPSPPLLFFILFVFCLCIWGRITTIVAWVALKMQMNLRKNN